MSSMFLRRLRDKLWPEPLPPARSFADQTILVTGATAGIGLAAAIHFATLGANVIITSRSLQQGSIAKDEIESRANIVGQGKIHILELDLNQYSSCVSLVDHLKKVPATRKGLDVAVLNAGLINADHKLSPEGWEQTIQVNTLSTTLLGLLLLQWLRHRDNGVVRTPPHLVFVTSRDHIDPVIHHWPKYAADEGILRHFSDAGNWPLNAIEPNYAISKLLLTYAIAKIYELAKGADGSVDVIVNSVCPGLVISSLGRSIAQRSALMKFAVPVYAFILGKSADYGARFYLKAARTREEDHGLYIQSLFEETEYSDLSFPNLRSPNALLVRALVWDEIFNELKMAVPALDKMEGI